MSSKMDDPAPGEGRRIKTQDSFGDSVTNKSNTAAHSAQSIPGVVPMPRNGLCHRYGLEPVSWKKAAAWIDRYNSFVDLWNQHELDPNLSLSPDWAEADIVCTIGSIFPINTLLFVDHDTQRFHSIFMRKWELWNRKKRAFIRNKADYRKVVWAGVAEPEGDPALHLIDCGD